MRRSSSSTRASTSAIRLCTATTAASATSGGCQRERLTRRRGRRSPTVRSRPCAHRVVRSSMRRLALHTVAAGTARPLHPGIAASASPPQARARVLANPFPSPPRLAPYPCSGKLVCLCGLDGAAHCCLNSPPSLFPPTRFPPHRRELWLTLLPSPTPPLSVQSLRRTTSPAPSWSGPSIPTKQRRSTTSYT